ncbi:hypothetical protein [Algoriphagus sp.]|uniref:hypothetical protein n=1 Tax=Algoriphagus sp. TaxID=1872435 RepID=UPI003F709480
MISNFVKNLIYLFVFGLTLYSCETKDSVSSDVDSQKIRSASFEKLDSVTIRFLGNPVVHDLDPISETIIFVDHKENSENIFIANFEGNILNSFSKSGDMPDSYRSMRANFKILSDSTFLVYSSNGFHTYNYSSELISKIKHNIDLLDYVEFGIARGLEQVGDKYLYWSAARPEMRHNDLRFYDKAYLLAWIYPETGQEEPIIRFPESSLFRSGQYFARDSWTPTYTVSGNLIYVVFGIEPVIYVYDRSSPYSLLSTIPLDLPDYQYYKGADSYDSGNEIKWFASRYGKIGNIKKVDNVFVVTYFPGYDGSDQEVSTSNLSPEERRLFRARMIEKYSHRVVVLDSIGTLLSEINPGNLSTISLISRNEELWMMENFDTEIERDYFRLFRVSLKLE